MKRIVILWTIASAVCAFSAITKTNLPWTISAYTSPKTSMIDANDQALRNGINQTIDTVNRLRDTTNKYIYKRSFTGSGAIVYATTPTIQTPIIDTINGSSNSVNISSGDTLKSGISILGGVLFKGDGELHSINNATTWVVIDSLWSPRAYSTNLVAGSFSASNITMNGPIQAVDITATHLLSSNGDAAITKRATASDFQASDSIISNFVVANTGIILKNETSSKGWILQPSATGANAAAIYNGSFTPGAGNYSFISSATTTGINVGSGGSILLNVNNSTKVTMTENDISSSIPIVSNGFSGSKNKISVSSGSSNNEINSYSEWQEFRFSANVTYSIKSFKTPLFDGAMMTVSMTSATARTASAILQFNFASSVTTGYSKLLWGKNFAETGSWTIIGTDTYPRSATFRYSLADDAWILVSVGGA